MRVLTNMKVQSVCMEKEKNESVTKPQCFPLLPSLLNVSPFFYKLPLPSVSVLLSHQQSTSFCLSFSHSRLQFVLSHSGSVAFLRPSCLAIHLQYICYIRRSRREGGSECFHLLLRLWQHNGRSKKDIFVCVVISEMLQVNCTHLLFTKDFCVCLFDPVSANITWQDLSSFLWGHELQCCWRATAGGAG